jgi:hypothetical protein
MPVVINEFETVEEQPPRGASTAQPAQRQAPPPPDVEQVLATRRARAERVRAY